MQITPQILNNFNNLFQRVFKFGEIFGGKLGFAKRLFRDVALEPQGF